MVINGVSRKNVIESLNETLLEILRFKCNFLKI